MSETARLLPAFGVSADKNPSWLRAEICTETKAAQLFCDADAGNYARFVPGLGWLIWTGMQWKRDDRGKIYDLACVVGEEYRKLAKQFEKKKRPQELVDWVLSYARKMQNTSSMNAFLEQAKHALHKDVSEFDADPLKVNFPNGTVDLHLYEKFGKELLEQDPEADLASVFFLNHSSSDYITRITAHRYESDRRAPLWEMFLARVVPDPDIRAFLKRAIGYSLTGLTREQCFFVLHGSGANGKSTFLNTLLRVIGEDYAMQGNPKSFLVENNDGIRNDLAAMRGARMIVAIETGDGRRLDEALVKMVTGGESIRTRFLYQEEFQFKPQFKLWLATNHLPRIHGTDYAIWRRVRLVPFTEQIPEAEQDRTLEDRLMHEAPGILAWAMDGAMEYLRDGLNPPSTVIQATSEYRENEDVLGGFIRECCILDPHTRQQSSELYTHYVNYTGSKISQKAFTKQMDERGFDRIKSDGVMTWIGIRLQ